MTPRRRETLAEAVDILAPGSPKYGGLMAGMIDRMKGPTVPTARRDGAQRLICSAQTGRRAHPLHGVLLVRARRPDLAAAATGS